jgi:hypothetical protein
MRLACQGGQYLGQHEDPSVIERFDGRVTKQHEYRLCHRSLEAVA